MIQEQLNKNLAVKKMWDDFNYLSNEKYSIIVSEKVNILLELINSLSIDELKVEFWKTWAEPIIFKLCYHTSSIIKLFYGTELPYKVDDRNVIIFDEPSVVTLLRVFLENYLTFNYLYGCKEDDEIKYFRGLIWRYSGVCQRTEFDITTEEALIKQNKEKEVLAKLKSEIIENRLFQKFNSKQKATILRGRNARLFFSWKDLILASNLNEKIFNNFYGFKSNYSHTEFVSIMQVKEGGYGHNSENTRSHYYLIIIQSIICKTIIELLGIFPSMNILFEKKDETLKEEIYSLSRISLNSSIS